MDLIAFRDQIIQQISLKMLEHQGIPFGEGPLLQKPRCLHDIHGIQVAVRSEQIVEKSVGGLS